MADGASRIFNVVKNTADSDNSVSRLVTLTVKTQSPLTFTLDDKIILTSEFTQLDSLIDTSKLTVGKKVSAISLNNEQIYYVFASDEVRKDLTASLISRIETLEGKVSALENQ